MSDLKLDSAKAAVTKKLAVAGGVVAILAITCATLIVLALKAPTPPTYSFVKADHPVQMWSDGKDTWAYYYVGAQSSGDLASDARGQLLRDGFQEEVDKPWFRFTKGETSVIVCNHDEFRLNGTSLVKVEPGPDAEPGRKLACVLVKNGLGTDTSLKAFLVKKLFNRW